MVQSQLRRKQPEYSHENPALIQALSEYNQADRALQKALKNARKESWQQAISRFTVETPVGDVWNQLKRLMGNNSHKKCQSASRYTALPLRDSQNKVILNPAAQAEALGDCWAEVSSRSSDLHGNLCKTEFCPKNHDKIMRAVHSWRDMLAPDQPQNKLEASNTLQDWDSSSSPSFNDMILKQEIEDALCKGSFKSAPGQDGITYQLISCGGQEALDSLLVLFNYCFKTGQIPHKWKEGITVPIPKQQSPESVDDYRPITLLSCVGVMAGLPVAGSKTLLVASINIRASD